MRALFWLGGCLFRCLGICLADNCCRSGRNCEWVRVCENSPLHVGLVVETRDRLRCGVAFPFDDI